MLWLTALLFFTTLTCTGLAALWATCGRGHRFVRAMLYAGVLALPLLVEAYEPFVAFLVQGSLVIGVVSGLRWRSMRSKPHTVSPTRLSLQNALLAIVPIAMLCAVAVRLPPLDAPTWANVVMIGIAAGVATLSGVWIMMVQKRQRLVCILAIAMTGIAGLPLIAFDEYFASIIGSLGRPPVDPVNWGGWLGLAPQQPIWIAILLIAAFQTALLGWLGIGLSRISSNPGVRTQRTRILMFSVLIAPTTYMPLWAMHELRNPLPVPNTELPTPNGYDDLLAAVALWPANAIVDTPNFDSNTATIDQLRFAVNEAAPAVDRARQGLSLSCRKAQDYNSFDLGLPNLQELRRISRGLTASAELAKREERREEAVALYLDQCRYGMSLARGGLVVDDLVGKACSSMGLRGLYSLRDDLPHEQLKHVVFELNSIMSEREPIEDFILRDKVWTQRAFGWHGHLSVWLSELSGQGNFSLQPAYENLSIQQLAENRLLQIEYALRIYKLEHGDWPETLVQLTPEIIPSVPADPFTADGKPLRYRKESDEYVLWSVGQNGVNDEGQAPPRGDYSPELGDLNLASFYEQWTDESDPDASNTNDDADTLLE